MKKIYMILAALSLLTMSLNAQVETVNPSNIQVRNTLNGKKFHASPAFSFNDVLKGIKGMSTILPELNPNGSTSSVGQFRAPLKVNADEVTLGPFTGDNFDQNNGAGFPTAYDQEQLVLINTCLTRDEILPYNGYDIVGFRFALASQSGTNNKARVYDFISWPESSNGYFEAANRHTWHLADFNGGGSSTAPGSITVGNGASVNEYLPVYGFYQDYGYHNQMIYSANQIALTSGSQITSITFYPQEGQGIPFSGSTVTVKLANTDVSNFGTGSTGNKITSGLTTVATITPEEDDNVTAWTITFTTPFTYTGSNLLVDVSCPGNGDYGHAYFYGDTQGSNVSLRSYGSSGSSASYGTPMSFLPKATFGYTGSAATQTDYVELTGGQWYEYYLDEPVEFVVNDSISLLDLGYTYWQYPSSNTTEMTYPIGYNSQSQTHDHWASLTVGTTPTVGNIVITVPSYYSMFYYIYVVDNETGNTLTYWTSSGTTSTYNGNTYYPLPTGWSHSSGGQYLFRYDANGDGSLYLGYCSSASQSSITINSSQLQGCTNVSVYIAAAGMNSGTNTIDVNGNTQTIENGSLAEYAWENIFNAPTSGWQHLTSFSSSLGDLAVQLILKSKQEKTPAPTITYTYDNGYYYITATATGDNAQNAQVTLNVNGTILTGTYSVTIPVGRSDQDYTVTATATAQEPDKAVSDQTTETITVQASQLDPSPTPTIDSDVLDLSVEVTGSSSAGDVHMYIDGEEVTNPTYLERGDEDYYVTVVVTNQINDGQHAMTTTTQQVLVPKLDDLDLTGWTQLPGSYTNDRVINWNDNLMFVDRFSASTANNNHPTQYTYVMTEDPIKLIGEPRNTNDHTIPVQTTRSKVWGYYTEQQVKDDTLRQVVESVLMNAEVQMTVEQSGEIYYYTLDRSRNSIVDENFLELSYLQNDGARYVEFDHYFTWQEPFQYGPVFRYDTINTVLPATAPQGDEGKHYGKYDDGDFMAYVPIVWTHGNSPTNTRLNWENDGLNNSYGSPIWRSAPGKVKLIGKPKLERQTGKDGSTNWMEDTVPCSIFMITDIQAEGYLPNPQISNIKYEPYMFRVWIESNKALLRNFVWVEGDPDDLDNRPGTHFEGRGIIPAGEPYLVWEEMISDNTTNIYDGETSDVIGFHKLKVTETETVDGDVHWTAPQEINMLFAAPDTLKSKDVKIYVRFYYRSTGEGLLQNNQNGMFLKANRGGENGYYGVEGDGDPDDEIPTFIKGIYTNTSHGEIVSVTYYNAQGMKSDKPFDGINIIVTRYSDGTATTTKVMR